MNMVTAMRRGKYPVRGLAANSEVRQWEKEARAKAQAERTRKLFIKHFNPLDYLISLDNVV